MYRTKIHAANPSERRKYRITVALAGTAFLVMALVLYHAASIKDVTRASNQAWMDYSEKSVAISTALGALHGSIGYGGLIHNFKNYVLRRDRAYFERSRENIAAARSAIKTLSSLIKDPDALADLETVKQTLTTYETKLENAFSVLQQQSATELDPQVRVDDGPALAALFRLSTHAKDRLATKREESLVQAERTERLVNIGFLIGILVAAGGAGLVVFSRRIEHRTHLQIVTAHQVDTLFEDSPDGLLLVNNKGMIERINGAALDLFGYHHSKELVGKPVETLVPPSAAPEHKAYRDGYFAAPTTRKMASTQGLTGLRRDGSEVPVDIALSPIPTLSQPATVVSCRDMTEMNQVNMELEKAVARAERLGEAKTRFLASMSHELRTPLNAVIGFSDLLKKSTSEHTADEKEFIKHIHGAGEHLLAMVNDLLDFAKTSDGQLTIEPRKFAIRPLIASIEGMMAADAERKHLQFRLNIGESVPAKLIGDETRIKQILLNLISNAIKFTDHGRVEVCVTATDAPEGEEFIQLGVQVSDTGIGIAPEMHDKIFNPFTQADDSITRRFGGTGLGLAISRQLARAMSGDLYISEQEGPGSTFTFTAKLSRTEETAEDAAQPQQPALHDPIQLSGKRILVVDDVKLNGLLIRSILKPHGVEVTWLGCGHEALDVMAQGPFDMVLMDMHMPEITGEETVKRFRETEKASQNRLPIIAWTADVVDFETQTNGDIWDGSLTKPTQPDDILSLIEQFPMRTPEVA